MWEERAGRGGSLVASSDHIDCCWGKSRNPPRVIRGETPSSTIVSRITEGAWSESYPPVRWGSFGSRKFKTCSLGEVMIFYSLMGDELRFIITVLLWSIKIHRGESIKANGFKKLSILQEHYAFLDPLCYSAKIRLILTCERKDSDDCLYFVILS